MLMKPEGVAQMLRWIADAVESGDSLEGNIQWSIPPDPDDMEHLHVHGAVRTGNLDGQGFISLLD